MALPNKTFWCNYNARNYNSTTLTLPKENGQLFDNDLVFPSAVTYNHNHITLSGDKRVHFTFNSTSENIFNRTSSTANITIIAKLSATNSTWFFANRDGNSASEVGYLVALGRNYRLEFVNYSYTTSTSPMIFTWRCGNGDVQYIAHSDNVVGTPYQSTNWARGEMKNIYFFGGNVGSESWAGDFYWLYMSPETLTDAEIQEVIDYNENIQPLIIPVNKYKLGANNITNTYEGGTKINKMYVGNDLVYRALPTTTPPHPIFIDYVYTTTESFINTSIVPTTSTKFRVKFKPTGLVGGVIIGYGPNTPITAGDSQDYRLFNHRGINDFTFDFNQSRFYGYGTTDENGMYDLTCGNNYIYDNVAGATAGTGTTQSSIAANNVPIYVGLKNSHEQIHQVTIYGDNDTVVFDGHATEFNGVYGIYDTVSGQLLQPTNGATVYGGTWQ